MYTQNMTDAVEFLFADERLDDALNSTLQAASTEVDKIPEERFLGTSDDDVFNFIYDTVITRPLELHVDRIEMVRSESEVDVSKIPGRNVFDREGPIMERSARFTVSIPFSGDAWLWKFTPRTRTNEKPIGRVISSESSGGGIVQLVINKPMSDVGDGESIRREIDNGVAHLSQYIQYQVGDISSHDQRLRISIWKYINNRRSRLGKLEDITKLLNIPLKRSQNAPSVSPLRIKRRLVKPLPSSKSQMPEHGIREEDYLHILKVIRHEGRSFETIPQTLAGLEEEDLRNLIVAHLNTHYEGDATGETFRRHGKTDIRIEFDNRSAFVAECKVWHGSKELSSSIDQILGYVTWRDYKSSLIIFNKQVAGFTGIQEKIPSVFKEHSKFLRQESSDQSGEWRFAVQSSDDEQQQVTIHVFLFDLFVSRKGNKSIR